MNDAATKHEIQVHDHAAEPDPWAHWRRRVAGERVPVFEGEPQWGYYRMQQRIDHPVAIFERNGELVAVVGPLEHARFDDPAKIWTWLTPIPKEIYDAAAREGKSFASAAMAKPLLERPKSNGDGRAWQGAKVRIIMAAAEGKGVRLTAKETAEAAAEFGSTT